VVLLDRDVEANFGGLARESFGGIFVVGSAEQRRAGIRDTPELALQDWLTFGEFGGDGESWPRRWAEAYVGGCYDDVYRWLKSHGVSFLPIPHWIERGQFTPGNSVPRFHIVWGTGQQLTLRLMHKLQSHPRRSELSIRFGYRVEALLTEGGRVIGCRGMTEDAGVPFELRAAAVIVAAGGINGCLARVRQHWHTDWNKAPSVLLNGSHKFADGTVHDAVVGPRRPQNHQPPQW
jgi:predicted oxidoreductase